METMKKMNNNATVNTNTKEEIVMKTVKELRVIAKAAGVKGYSKMNKADLVAAIQSVVPVIDDATVSVGDLSITKDNAPAFEEPVVEEKKDDVKVRNRRLLLNLLCYRWVAESRLFYKSNKYKEEGGDYFFIASRKRQLGVTCKCLKDLCWQANPVTLDRVAEILREEGIVVSATRDVYIPAPIWQKFTKGKELLDKRKGDKDIITYLKEVIK